jgi:HPt (histidine-containing phosphotransfer) domain-containing protein
MSAHSIVNAAAGATNSPALDRSIALARVGGDTELLKELADLFLIECPRQMAELHDASARGDAKCIERTAHGLKGSVANFGAQAATDAAWRLEQLGREQRLTEVAVALNCLEQALAAVKAELSSL